MTRDNLWKRHITKPLDCVYCTEDESVFHLFFDCTVARILWSYIRVYFNTAIGSDYESVARYWISNKKTCCPQQCQFSYHVVPVEE